MVEWSKPIVGDLILNERPNMNADEQQIRELVSVWFEASKRGDVETVLGLMTDEVIFLITGREPMVGKKAFADAMTLPAGVARPVIEGSSEVREIRLFGNIASLWTNLRLSIMPPGGGAPILRAGDTFSMLRKVNGRWLLDRDANMLATFHGEK